MPDTQQPQKTPVNDFEARRRLLKLGAYVPPAILGMMIMGQRSAWASGGKGGKGGKGGGGHGASCNPSACSPCIIKGGKKGGSFEYNKNNHECKRSQKKYKRDHGE